MPAGEESLGRAWSRARAALRAEARPLATGFAFRTVCFVAMVALAIWAEARPAPSLPDLLLPFVPHLAWVERYNYLLWLAVVVAPSVAFLLVDARRVVRYLFSAGLLDLLRGLCIVATGLGPVRGPDLHAGMTGAEQWQALAALLSPLGFVGLDPPTFYLTKDLFFSGHTASTFLLLLYVWPYRRLRPVVLVGHLLVVASVFFAHLHYTIDVLGAYAFALALFALREADWRGALGRAP